MARALESVAGGAAPQSEVSDWVLRLCGELLDERARIVAEIERSSTRSRPPLAFPSSGAMRTGGGPGLHRLHRLHHRDRHGSERLRRDRSRGVSGVSGVSGVTALTGVAPAALPEPARSRSLPTIALFLMGALVLVSLTVSAVLLLQAGHRSSTAEGTAAAPTDVATAAVVRRPEASGSAAVSNAEPKPTATAASATAAPAGAAAAAAKTTASTTTPSPSAAPSAHRTGSGSPATGGRVNCDPPYVVDKNGHQHFIPECLK